MEQTIQPHTEQQTSLCRGCNVNHCPHRSNYTSGCAIRTTEFISFTTQARRVTEGMA